MADLVTVEQVRDHLNIPTTDHDAELEQFIAAATAHAEYRYGVLPSGTYTEVLTAMDDGVGTFRYWLTPAHAPITAVTSATAEDGTEYTTDFTISTDGRRIRHESITSGEWVVAYTAGQTIPADLKLAALEDIRGLYQPGQIGPPSEFGAFGALGEDPTSVFRPVNMWPRIDNWINARLGPAIA